MERSRNLSDLVPGHREEQFVVVAAVQGQVERRCAVYGRVLRQAHDGQFLRIDAGTHRACSAEAGQVGGEAIGKVHHGGREAFSSQPLAQRQSGFGVKMFAQDWIAAANAGLAFVKEAET